MTPGRLREVESHLRSLDDAALRRLVYLEVSHYEREAVAIAFDEARRRGMQGLTIEQYAQQFPDEWLEHVGFCYRCWTETTEESPGLVFTVYLIGTRLLWGKEACPTCGSFVARKWFCVVVPILPRGWYRLCPRPKDYRYPSGHIGRRLKR
jgi:hypothetical protein